MGETSEIWFRFGRPAEEAVSEVARVLGVDFDRAGAEWKSGREEQHLLLFRSSEVETSFFVDDGEEPWANSDFLLRYHGGSGNAPAARVDFERLKTLGVPMTLSIDSGDTEASFTPALDLPPDTERAPEHPAHPQA